MTDQDRLAEIKARMREHADTEELRQRYFRIHGAMDLRWLVGEVERRDAELRLARAVIHTLMWESSVIITEQPRLRDALKAWGEADKVKLNRPDPP